MISSETTSPTAPWRDRTLCRLVDDVRSLLPASAVGFATLAEETREVTGVTGWFGSDELRDALCAGGGPGPVEAALERGRPLLLPRVDAWQAAPLLLQGLGAALGETRGRRAWSAFRSCSLIACPIRSDLDRTLGVLVIVSDDRPSGSAPQHLRTVEVLASLAALALDRADLLEAEAGARPRGGPPQPRRRDALRLARARRGLRARGAAGGRGHRRHPGAPDARQLAHRRAAHGGARRLLGRARRPARLDRAPAASREVARTRRPLLRAGEAGARRTRCSRRPASGRCCTRRSSSARASTACSPSPIPTRTFLGEQSLELLTKLARAAAAAIANAIDFERERRIARALTLGFVPGPLPELPGYETGLLYSPAANEPTGGDVYGAWPVGDGTQMAMLVGDVAGKGVETAALSSMVRFFVEARSWDSLSPAAVLEQTNRMLLGRLPRDTFVTAFLGVLSHESLRYCNAGHLPPLRVRGGRAEPLDLHGLPLGVDERGQLRGERARARGRRPRVRLHRRPGRGAPRRRGLRPGAADARSSSGWPPRTSPAELVAAMHDDVAAWGDGLADDAVALALRRAT